ncbi:MAG: hypothetical protein IAE81_08180 [Caldilineaceae bacterium]|jgi:hypothetical protein|nr:hypothetical protein [Caldilineaceae bacterium]
MNLHGMETRVNGREPQTRVKGNAVAGQALLAAAPEGEAAPEVEAVPDLAALFATVVPEVQGAVEDSEEEAGKAQKTHKGQPVRRADQTELVNQADSLINTVTQLNPAPKLVLEEQRVLPGYLDVCVLRRNDLSGLMSLHQTLVGEKTQAVKMQDAAQKALTISLSSLRETERRLFSTAADRIILGAHEEVQRGLGDLVQQAQHMLAAAQKERYAPLLDSNRYGPAALAEIEAELVSLKQAMAAREQLGKAAKISTQQRDAAAAALRRAMQDLRKNIRQVWKRNPALAELAGI